MSIEGVIGSEWFLVWLIQKTIDAGCPPRRAMKWWLYIFQALKKRREQGEQFNLVIAGDYVAFLMELGILDDQDLADALT